MDYENEGAPNPTMGRVSDALMAQRRVFSAGNASPTTTKDVPLSTRLFESFSNQAQITEASIQTLLEYHHRHFGPTQMAAAGNQASGALRDAAPETTEVSLTNAAEAQTQRVATLGHLIQSVVNRL